MIQPKFVYFMRPVGQTGPVKIGCSQTPVKRLRSLEIWSPLMLELVASAPGSHAAENALHQMFCADRRHGEWFEYSERLGRVMEYVQRSGKLPPLDLDSRPVKTGLKSGMVRRNQEATVIKRKVTVMVSSAEQHAFGFEKPVRPDEVSRVIARYQGFDEPAPTAEEMAILTAYAQGLRQLPRASRGFVAWQEWHAKKLAGKAA